MLSVLPLCFFAAQIGGGFLPAYSIDGPHEESYFGSSVLILDDWNGDGIDDFAVGAYTADSSSGIEAGVVTVYSGADQAVLHTYSGRTDFNHFGFSLDRIDDLDGDGKSDLLVGAVPFFPSAIGVSYVSVYSSLTGGFLYSVSDGMNDSNFGHWLEDVGDINLDGIPDFLVGAVATDFFDGAAYLYSGLDGRLIRSHLGSSSTFLYGKPGTIGDLNMDGIPEYSISEPGYGYFGASGIISGRIEIRDGASGSVIQELFGEDYQGYGFHVTSLGDINGDAIPEFIVKYEDVEPGLWYGPGALDVYNGSTMQVIYRIKLDLLIGGFGGKLRLTKDLDGDGLHDIFTYSSWQNPVGQKVGAGHFYSAKTGKLLYQLEGSAGVNDFSAAAASPPNSSSPTEMIGGNATWGIESHGRVSGFSLEPYLTLTADTISDAAGGLIQMELGFPTIRAGAPYLILASHGVGPVFPGGLEIPLSNDPLLSFSRSSGVPMLMNGTGYLGVAGKASASWNVTPGSIAGQIGSTVYFAAVTLDGTGVPQTSSKASAVVILP